DVNGQKLAALYTLQDRLAAHTQSERGLEHRDVARWCVIHETRAQLASDANPPRCARRELLAGDETVIQPAVHGGGRDAENLRGAIDRDDVALLRKPGSLEAWNLPVRAQAADSVG